MSYKIEVDESSILRFLARYLLERESYETLATLLLETNTSLFNHATQVSLFIQLLCLQGRWDELIEYLKPLLEVYPTISKQILFLVLKQKLLETLSWKGGSPQRWILPPWKPSRTSAGTDLDEKDEIYIDLNDILLQINELKEYCNAQQFNSLCMFLTLEDLHEHPEYKTWSVCQGRVHIFVSIQQFLSNRGIDSTVFQRGNVAGIDSMKWLWSAAFSSCQTVLENIQFQDSQTKIIFEKRKSGSGLAVQSLNELLSILVSQPPREVTVEIRPNATIRQSSSLQSALATSVVPLNPPSEELFDRTQKWPTAAPQPFLQGDNEYIEAKSSDAGTLYSGRTNNIPSNTMTSPPTSEKERSKPVSWTVDLGGHAKDKIPSNEEVKQPPSHVRRRVQETAASKEDISCTDENNDNTRGSSSRLKKGVENKAEEKTKSNSKMNKNDLKSETAAHDQRQSSSPKITPSNFPPPIDAIRGANSSAFAPVAVSYPNRFLLFQTDCPIRCAAEVTSAAASDRVTMAIGSNAKNIHIFSYPRPRFPSNSSSGAVDYTASVLVEKTIENSHKGSIYTLDYFQTIMMNSGILASGSNDKLVKLWRPLSDSSCVVLKGHTGTVRAVKFRNFPNSNSSETLLASCGAGDFRPRIWNVQAESCQRIFSAHSDTVHGLAWVNENTLITGCESGSILVHDLRSSSSIASFTLSDAILSEGVVGLTTTSLTRSICCLSSLAISSEAGASPVSWEDAIIAVGCTQGHCSILRHNKLLLDNRIHGDDIRSIELTNYRASDQTSTPFSSSVHEADLVTSSYDATSAYWRLTTNEDRAGTTIREEVKLVGIHQEKNLSAIILKKSQDIITTAADGKVVLWCRA